MSGLDEARPSWRGVTARLGSAAIQRLRTASVQERALGGLVAITVLVRIIPAWILQIETADVASNRTMAEAIVRGDNIYAYHVLYWYNPFAQFHPALSLLIANGLGARFDFVFKLAMIAADAGTTFLIFWYLLRHGQSLRSTIAWTFLWVLNPVSILISAFHGAPHSIVCFLAVAAFVAADIATDGVRRPYLLAISALALGLGIALRTIPILLLPCFLVLITRTVREVATYAALALLASVANLIPYLIFASETLLRETVMESGTLDYSGYTDFGWVAVVRAAGLLFGRPRQFMVRDQELLDGTKLLFVLAYLASLLVLPYFRRASLGRALMLSSLLFYTLYAGVASQYLVWVLPLAIILRQRLTIPYTMISATALISFYTTYYAPILFGRYAPLIRPSDAVLATYGISNILLVALCGAWIARTLFDEITAYRRAGAPVWVPWVHKFARLWSSVWYRRAAMAVGAISAVQLARTLARAQEVARPMFG